MRAPIQDFRVVIVIVYVWILPFHTANIQNDRVYKISV